MELSADVKKTVFFFVRYSVGNHNLKKKKGRHILLSWTHILPTALFKKESTEPRYVPADAGFIHNKAASLGVALQRHII
jgi:hypothetical protein